MPYEIQHVHLNDGGDEEGALVFIDGDLTGALSKLGAAHDERAGRWHIEHAFGLNLPGEQVFETIDAAATYLERLRTEKRRAQRGR